MSTKKKEKENKKTEQDTQHAVSITATPKAQNNSTPTANDPPKMQKQHGEKHGTKKQQIIKTTKKHKKPHSESKKA